MQRLKSKMRSKYFLLALFGSLVLVTFNICSNGLGFDWFFVYNTETLSTAIPRFESDPLSIVNASVVAFQPGNQSTCVTRSVSGLQIPICLYSPKEDIYISAKFQSNVDGYYDSGMVSNILSMLRKLNVDVAAAGDDNAPTFIDIGANIGSYSLAAAHQANRVISIEPNWNTLRYLATSVVLGNLTGRVTILHNAITNDTSGSIVQLGVQADNRGKSWVLDPDHCWKNPQAAECTTGRAGTVGTITLDDLSPLLQPSGATLRRVIMKVDAEGSECKIFDARTASRFMATVDVIAIQMEWQWMLLGIIKSPDIDGLLKFFNSQNYTVHAVSDELPEIKTSNWHEWPGDVMFVKQHN